ncbi:nucleotidyltransferase domain-containing protein [Dyella choica]|uniref:Nucleotidyltransferase domain-containing protein n=1 Tax=Dyella choica TaxID=1927959 RepID=A0A3S0PIN0_9GAMM|nr:nucleotidyltransferase domain-containing protein [Dyella choica]RUL75919.1 nucleotidyltransferase domain-containing protein [Dyella choica]
MNEAIQQAIDAIENDYGVHVLYAAESGSRAWGFASPDSDYDVRFVYVHPQDWYLSVFESRDVIERMLPGDLDVSGWDLRKALRLMSKCNLAFNEWFDSPIVYREEAAFVSAIRRLIPQFFQPARALFHYLSMASSTHAEHLCGDSVRLKKVFYFLRSVQACRWIEHTRTQPPTEFSRLIAAPWVSDEERGWIGELEARKTVQREGDSAALPPFLRRWMQAQLEHLALVGPALARKSDVDQALLDEVLRAWVIGA